MSAQTNQSNGPTKEQNAIISIGSRGIQLSTYDELYRFSKLIVNAGLAPRSIDTPEKVFLTLQYSMEMGFSPMIGLQNAMIINNRVSYYGEFVVGLVQNHPDFQDMKHEYFGEGQDLTCKVTLTRKGVTPSVGTFSIRQAQHLINDPNKATTWGKYPRRMLFWRAFSMAKTIFSDALKGISLPTDFDEADVAKPAKVTEVVTISKPVFNEDKESSTTERPLDRVPSSDQLAQTGIPATGDRDGATVQSEGSPEGGDNAQALPSDSGGDRSPEPPQPKPENKSAKRLLALINKHGHSQVEVIDFISEFDIPIGQAKETGLVDDLPEETTKLACAQFPSIHHSLKPKTNG